MNTLIVNQEQSRYRGYGESCPYNGVTVCNASFSSMAIDNKKREKCCDTDAYDSCPLFLSKALRRS